MNAPAERGTRERILDVAETFFAESGYHGTRLHQIAERVGIQKASLFHYFNSKADLYRAVLDKNFGEIEEALRRVLDVEGEAMDKVRALVEAYVDLVATHLERTKISLRQSLGDAPSDYQPTQDAQRILDLVVQFVAKAQQAHRLAPIDPTALVLGVAGMVAFFFTSASVLGEAWAQEPWSQASIERVKRHVVDVVQRCLALPSHSTSRLQVAAG